MFHFWSLSRSGLAHVSGKPSVHALCAALRSCGAPRPFVRIARCYQNRSIEIGLDFWSGKLFRCSFALRIRYK